jgi:threonylcarbamoyladenosine tRNA methylthiotransferase MtaB
MKYSVITFGCRVNQADSMAIEEELLAQEAERSSPPEADLIVVNTCSVTASADQGARQTIRRIARSNPAARIVVTGCYATRKPEEVRALPGVVSVVPNDDKRNLMSLLHGIQLSPSQKLPPALKLRRPAEAAAVTDDADLTSAERFGEGDGSCGAVIQPGVAGRTAYTLRVQTGCAEPCSYCIIPTTRGEPVSVPPSQVLREVERVAAAGFKEIVLTGVHLGSYGRDLVPSSSLVELLQVISKPWRPASAGRNPPEGESHTGVVDGPADLLFRISSLEPMDCTPDVVRLVAAHDCFAPHFHLPLQHASDRMLALMRRPYTVAYYSALVNDIRTRMPHASIGSDIIVGFPGETDADFDQLARYLEDSPLTHVHVFPYSDRPGTPATGMPNKVPGLTVRERARRVREISSELARRFRDSQVGTEHRALTLDDGTLAVTGNYMKVRISPGTSRNEWVRVRIISEHDGELLCG